MLQTVWRKIVIPIARGFGITSSILCAGLALLLVLEVMSRGLGFGSIRGIYEMAELALVIVALLGFSQAEVNNTHVRVSLLTDRLSARIRSMVRGVAMIVVTAFLVWMGIELTEKAVQSFITSEYRTGLLNFPVWPSRSFVALGVCVLSLVTFFKGLLLITGQSTQVEEMGEEGYSVS